MLQRLTPSAHEADDKQCGQKNVDEMKLTVFVPVNITQRITNINTHSCFNTSNVMHVEINLHIPFS